jgi:metal-dependent HD superfamily phosphatase/phosphodiesterase
MLTKASPKPAAGLPLPPPVEPLPFAVPARHNPRLHALAERINVDDELRQLWRCANANAVERLGLGDCGEVHVRIVANAALKLLRLLRDAGVPPAAVQRQRLAGDDAEVVVVLAAALHDLDLAVGAGDQPSAGLALAALKGRELLTGVYGVRERTIVLAEALHAISAQPAGALCLTREAAVLRLADALDLAKGRVRMPSDPARGPMGTVPVEEVTILNAKGPPVQVVIRLSQAEARGAMEALLHHRLRGTGLDGQIAILAQVDSLDGGRPRALHIWDTAPAEPA